MKPTLALGLAAMFAAACGGGAMGSGDGDGYVAATIDGQVWRATGLGSRLTNASGLTSFTILGYTPLDGSRQADTSKPQLEILFSDLVPSAGSYDVTGTPALTMMYMPDRLTLYGAETGVVTIARITPFEAEGTFRFDGLSGGATPQPVTVTAGEFRVPVGP